MENNLDCLRNSIDNLEKKINSLESVPTIQITIDLITQAFIKALNKSENTKHRKEKLNSINKLIIALIVINILILIMVSQ